MFSADYNILDAHEEDVPEVSPACTELFKKIGKKLRFAYKPDLFANPYLQVC